MNSRRASRVESGNPWIRRGNQNTQNSGESFPFWNTIRSVLIWWIAQAASYVINKAMDAGTPVVFFNREPVEGGHETMGAPLLCRGRTRESAVLQGEILVDAYQENPGSLDLNEDGTVGYVMLEGERSHQDSLIRTEWSVQTMRDGDIPLEKSDRWFGKLGSEPSGGTDGTVGSTSSGMRSRW